MLSEGLTFAFLDQQLGLHGGLWAFLGVVICL
jgi:hypothetical protein